MHIRHLGRASPQQDHEAPPLHSLALFKRETAKSPSVANTGLLSSLLSYQSLHISHFAAPHLFLTMNRYRPTLLRRSDSISTRWVQSQEEARDGGLSSEHRPSTITLPSTQVSQSPKQAAAQAAALKARFPDVDNDELNDLIDQFQ